MLPCGAPPPPQRLHDHAGGAGGLGTTTGAFSAYSASFEGVVETAKAGPSAATTAVQAFLASSVTKIEELGPLGAVYFGVLYVLAEVLIIPALPLTTAAGFLFGVAGGTAVVLTSATIAAAISFQLGRTLLRWARDFPSTGGGQVHAHDRKTRRRGSVRCTKRKKQTRSGLEGRPSVDGGANNNVEHTSKSINILMRVGRRAHSLLFDLCSFNENNNQKYMDTFRS